MELKKRVAATHESSSNPDGLIYRLLLLARCTLSEVTLYLTLNTLQTRKLCFFSALETRVFRLQNERQWTSWET